MNKQELIYKMYKENKTIEEIKEEIKDSTIENIQQEIKEIQKIEDSVAIDDTWKYGTELEYGGYDNKLSMETDNNIIEDIKTDRSVSGDGREYNLIPMEFNSKNRELESFCYRAANKNCIVNASAGEHFHYSWNKIEEYMGTIVRTVYTEAYSISQYNTNLKSGAPISYRDIRKLVTNVEDFELKEQSDEQIRKIKLYEAMQFLYSTSNRVGTEPYGLGSDGTRGYTRHGTIELRAWRTTLDYRSIICRAEIGRFFLRWILEKMQLATKGYIKWKDISIWNDFREENEDLKNKYTYLAFNINNKHKVGLSEFELMKKLDLRNPILVKAIKQRSALIQRSLYKGNGYCEAKELFKNI